MPPVIPPFLIGLIAAPIAKRIVTPLLKGVVKTSVGLVLEVKRAAHEASEGLHDLAAEVTAEVVAAQLASTPAAVPASGAGHAAKSAAAKPRQAAAKQH